MTDFKKIKEDDRFKEIQQRLKEIADEQDTLFKELEERWPVSPQRKWVLFYGGFLHPSLLFTSDG